MSDIPALLQELEDREKQIQAKLSKILEGNPNPFPHDKINTAKCLLELIGKAKEQIDKDNMEGLGVTLGKLKEVGLKIKNDLE